MYKYAILIILKILNASLEHYLMSRIDDEPYNSLQNHEYFEIECRMPSQTIRPGNIVLEVVEPLMYFIPFFTT